jgi:hypothetical protein
MYCGHWPHLIYMTLLQSPSLFHSLRKGCIKQQFPGVDGCNARLDKLINHTT